MGDHVVNAASLGSATMPSRRCDRRRPRRAPDAGRLAARATSDRRRRPSRSRPRSRRAPRGSPEPVSRARPPAATSGDHAPDDDVGKRGGQLLGHRGAAVGLPAAAGVEHRAQALGGHDLGQRPPAPARTGRPSRRRRRRADTRDRAREAGGWIRAAAARRLIAMREISGSSTTNSSWHLPCSVRLALL